MPPGDHDLDARNRDFLDYDQVEKRQDYRLAEGAGDEFDDDFEIRTCDVARFVHGGPCGRMLFALELGAALEEIGFAILVGHGIDPALWRRAETETRRVFERPLADKLRFRAERHGAVNEGYFPLEETSGIHPDLVEGWVFGRRAFDLDDDGSADVGGFWPDPACEAVFREVCRAGARLILPIMQAVLSYLGCDPRLFDERLSVPSLALRLNYYPPLTPDQAVSGAGRLLGHEDVDLFTLLPAPRTEGLQVLNRRNLRWVRLDAPAHALILNTGDYMQRVTNDRLPSTTHRVGSPRDPASCRDVRVSFPMNVYLREDDVLEVLPGLGEPRYEPIRAITFHTRTTAKYYGDGYAVE